MYTVEGGYATAKVFADSIDNETLGQITKIVGHPAFKLPEGEHIAIMPDTHAGKGSVIGFTMPLHDRVVPNVVGVDIGCGMLGVRGSFLLRDSLEEVDRRIRERVPMGFEVDNESRHCLKPESLLWPRLRWWAERVIRSCRDRGYDVCGVSAPRYCYEWYESMCDRVGMSLDRAQASVGSLGGGNHFIELGRVGDTVYISAPRAETKDSFWLIVHSGSRQIGQKICNYWQRVATQKMESKRKDEYEAGVRRIWESSKDEDIRNWTTSKGAISSVISWICFSPRSTPKRTG